MKKVLFLMLFAMLFLTQIRSQVALNPDKISVQLAPGEHAEISFQLTNNDTITYKSFWKIENVVDLPSGWEFNLCDNFTCYDTNVSESNTNNVALNVLEPGLTNTWSFKITNNSSEEGSYCLKLSLYDSKDTKNVIGTTDCISGTSDALNTTILKVYPNPTERNFSINGDDNIHKVGVYNILGKEMKMFKHEKGDSHDISELNRGLYIVRLFDIKGKAVKSLKLNKR